MASDPKPISSLPLRLSVHILKILTILPIKATMASDPKPILFFLFFSILFLSSSSEDTQPTVYDILEKYGLPRGLLPDSVTSYTLADDGKFVVNLKKPCYLQFDYLVYYEKKITGTLNIGSITNLKGIQVKRLLLFWFDVDEIRVDLPPSDSIYFTVGFINKELDVDQFLTVRTCTDNAISALPCGGGAVAGVGGGGGRLSLKKIFQLPDPVDDIPMLITE